VRIDQRAFAKVIENPETPGARSSKAEKPVRRTDQRFAPIGRGVEQTRRSKADAKKAVIEREKILSCSATIGKSRKPFDRAIKGAR